MKLTVKAHPKSSKEAVVCRDDTHYEVWVREAPDKGRATEAVLEALAEHFGVAKSRVTLVSGAASRVKTVLVER